MRSGYGYQRQLALWTTSGGPGCHPFPLDVPGYGSRMEWQEISRRFARRTGLVGQRSHRPEDPTESAEKRQGFPDSISLSSRTVAGEVVIEMASQTVLPAPQLAGYAEELARAEIDITELQSRLERHPRDLEK